MNVGFQSLGWQLPGCSNFCNGSEAANRGVLPQAEGQGEGGRRPFIAVAFRGATAIQFLIPTTPS